MTFAEFQEKDLSCDECPIRKAELCHHDLYRDPPCSFVDAEKDMDEWIRETEENQIRYERLQDEKAKKEHAKEEESKKRREIIVERNAYCRVEAQEVKKISKELRRLEKIRDDAEKMTSAINFANQIFGYKERKTVSSHLLATILQKKGELAKAKQAYKEKRKEFYKRRKTDVKV